MTNQDTSNKVAILAGVGPGMGIAIARRFAREGFAIGLIARDKTRLSCFTSILSTFDVPVAAESADL